MAESMKEAGKTANPMATGLENIKKRLQKVWLFYFLLFFPLVLTFALPVKGLWKEGKFIEGEFHDASYQGNIKDGKRIGFGVLTQKKNKYEGEWLDDKRNGKGKIFSIDGKIQYEGDWVNDLPEGKTLKIYAVAYTCCYA